MWWYAAVPVLSNVVFDSVSITGSLLTVGATPSTFDMNFLKAKSNFGFSSSVFGMYNSIVELFSILDFIIPFVPVPSTFTLSVSNI